jgi:hypothetical protein
MKTRNFALHATRGFGAIGCAALLWADFFGPGGWHVWVAHFYGVAGTMFAWLVPHAVLPFLYPSRRGLILVVALYSFVWWFVWHQYSAEVAADPMNADTRGLTSGLFVVANFAFIAGLVVRLGAPLVVSALRSSRLTKGQHAV